jgi:hypothetical protein
VLGNQPFPVLKPATGRFTELALNIIKQTAAQLQSINGRGNKQEEC